MDRDSKHSDTWKRVRELFEQLLEYPAEKREGLLRQEEPRESIRDEVRMLLGADQGEDSLLDSPAWNARRDSFPDESLPMLDTGAKVGNFQIVRTIASGGMGVVYEARQESPRRLVALKTLRGSSGASLVRRFRLESEILGYLSHPNVARIYESGTFHHQEGEYPYFAMEIVEGGIDVVSYVHRHELTTPRRLELFFKICSAVQYGHQRGVIHRDLKPSNILVDRHGEPKVIDFGLAKLQHKSSLAVSNVATLGRGIHGTLQYMSPEQFKGSKHGDIDVTSDVYALGVVLYEMLSGASPYDWGRRSLAEIVRLIDTVEPERLDDRRPELRGDLTWIVHRAMAKERDRRYASVSELVQDLRRFLDFEPVNAGPPSQWYRLRKVVRRHRLFFASLGAIVVSLVFGLALALWQWTLAEERLVERDIQFAIADESNQFLGDLFRMIDPSMALGRDVSLHEVLEASEARVEASSFSRGEVEISVRRTLARAYASLGDHMAASRHLERASVLSEETFGAESHTTLATINDLLTSALEVRPVHQVQEFSRRAREIASSMPQAPESLRMRALLNEALVAEKSSRVLEARDKLESLIQWEGKGDNVKEIRLEALRILADLCDRTGEFERGRNLLLRAVEERTVQDRRHPSVILDDHALAMFEFFMGDENRSVETLLDALERADTVLGSEHPTVVVIASDYGYVCTNLGRRGEAEAAFDRVLSALRGVRGRESWNHLSGMLKVGNALEACQMPTEAREVLGAALSAHDRMGTATTPLGLHTRMSLANVISHHGDIKEGEAAYVELIAEMEAHLSPDDWILALTRMNLGGLYNGTGRIRAGYELVNQAAASLEKTCGPTNGMTLLARRNEAFCLVELGRPREALPVLRQVVAIRRETLPASHEDRLTAEVALVRALERSALFEEAESVAGGVFDVRRNLYGVGHPRTGEVMTMLVRILASQDKLEDARTLAEELREAFGMGAFHSEFPQVYGPLLSSLGQHEEAVEFMRRALEIAERSLPSGHFTIDLTRAYLAQCLLATDDSDLGEDLMLVSLGQLTQTLGEDHWRVREFESILEGFYASEE